MKKKHWWQTVVFVKRPAGCHLNPDNMGQLNHSLLNIFFFRKCHEKKEIVVTNGLVENIIYRLADNKDNR